MHVRNCRNRDKGREPQKVGNFKTRTIDDYWLQIQIKNKTQRDFLQVSQPSKPITNYSFYLSETKKDLIVGLQTIRSITLLKHGDTKTQNWVDPSF